MKNSRICNNKEQCYLCGRYLASAHKHHIFFGTANRKLSDADGMFVFLCHECHEHSKDAVHVNHEVDLQLKQEAQAIWENEIGNRDQFRNRYGRSYL